MSTSSPVPAPPSTGSRSQPASWLGWLGAAWGVFGVCLLLASAVWRLSPIAWEALSGPLSAGQVIFGAVWVLFMAYSEGYKGFQRAFSPRVVVRADWLARNPRPWLVALAPAFCMGLVHATRKRRTVSWVLLVVIVGLVVAVKQLPSPWRGLIDAGVVVGLSWGIAATLAVLFRAWRGALPDIPPDVPPS